MKRLIIFLLFLCACTARPPKFVEWKVADYQNFPGLVAVTAHKTNPHCTGVLVKPNIVLTAGHCLDDYDAEEMFITSGCNAITNRNKCTYTQAKATVFHPWFNKGYGVWNDLGVILTKKDVPIKPATIGTIEDIYKAKDFNLELVAAGFGMRPGGGILFEGNVVIRQHHIYEFYGTEETGGSCSGDSGGPAYIKDFDGSMRVIGILSRSKRNKSFHCGGPSSYTVPTPYLEWIDEMSKL